MELEKDEAVPSLGSAAPVHDVRQEGGDGDAMVEDHPAVVATATSTTSPDHNQHPTSGASAAMPEEAATPATTETTAEVAGSEGKEHADKQRIYVAGKMMFFNAPSRDWRGLGRFKELEWRSDQEALPLLDKMRGLRDLELEWDDNWVYVGPHFLSCPGLDHDVDYFYQLDDEPRSGTALASVLRDEQRDFTVDEREKQVLYDNARHQISKCDVLYARLTDQKDCFWTFVEIGIAAALGKRVYIDCPVESHDTWLLPHLAEQSKGTREEYGAIPWALYKH